MMVQQWYYRNVLYVVVKNQDLFKKKANGILSHLDLKTPLNKIPLLVGILFWMKF